MADIDAKTWLESVTLDEDTMSSDSDSDVCTQQSIKAYVDTNDASTLSTANGYTDSELAAYGSGGDLAADLLAYHDIVINSTVGVELQTQQFKVTACSAPLMLPIGAFSPGISQWANNGAGSLGISSYAFDASTEESLWGSIRLETAWNKTAITPAIFWRPTSTATPGQVVNWGLEYIFLRPSPNHVVGNTTIVSQNVHAPAETLTNGYHYITIFSPISPPAADVYHAIGFRVFRDATGALGTDDYANDAILGGVACYYYIDRLAAPLSELS